MRLTSFGCCRRSTRFVVHPLRSFSPRAGSHYLISCLLSLLQPNIWARLPLAHGACCRLVRAIAVSSIWSAANFQSSTLQPWSFSLTNWFVCCSWSSTVAMFSKKKKKLDISLPKNFEHRVHTGFDKRENRYVGLPPQWAGIVSPTPSAKGALSSRPTPLIDPSEITPTEVLDLKVNSPQ